MVLRRRMLLVACAALLMALVWALFGPAHSAAATTTFVAPLPTPLTVLGAFDPPAQPWLPGNRGVDLAATAGEPVVAAADGVVVYAGPLAGRGVVSINHGAIRTTYEPVDAVVVAGESVRHGQVIGRVSSVADSCGPPGGCLHWGAIRGGGYLDPLLLLATPRVRLLPIWADGLPTAPPDPTREAATSAVPMHGGRSAAPTAAIGVGVVGTAGAALAGGTAIIGVRTRRAKAS